MYPNSVSSLPSSKRDTEMDLSEDISSGTSEGSMISRRTPTRTWCGRGDVCFSGGGEEWKMQLLLLEKGDGDGEKELTATGWRCGLEMGFLRQVAEKMKGCSDGCCSGVEGNAGNLLVIEDNRMPTGERICEAQGRKADAQPRAC